MKRDNLLLGLVYAALLVWALVACVQVLSPLATQIANDKALLAVTINPDLQVSLAQDIATQVHHFSALLLLHLGSIIFLAYLVIARGLNLLHKRLPRLILPVVAGVNLLLCLAAALVCPAALGLNFYTLALPLAFMGIFPLLIGVKIVVKK